MMTALNTQSNIAEIAAVFNELKGTSTDVKTLAKRGKTKLLAQIEELRAAKATRDAAETAAQKAAAKAEAKAAKGPTTREVAEGLLTTVVDGKGLTYEDILAKVQAAFPDAKTSVPCLRWYAAHMKKAGVVLPTRPRTVKAKAEAVETTETPAAE